MDLIVRNAALSTGEQGVDIACKDGKIAAIEPNLKAESPVSLDAEGQLVVPPFVDSHFHMDATLSLGRPRLNGSGTLLEGISLWNELKPIQSVEDIYQRAMQYCDLAVAQGLLAVRTHVDICDDELKGVDALTQVKKDVAPYLDLQLVAFPQDGFYRSPSARANLLRALDKGVEVVGGIPHFERTMGQGDESVKELCEIAAERGLRVDMHCDESDDPHSRHIEALALHTQRLGLQGRVAGSHLTSMHSMDNYYVSKLLPLIAEAQVSAIPNPLINITLQGRHNTYPKIRGLTRVRELRDQGIDVAFGSDCVMDPWYSLGRADMLEVASMGLHVGQLTSRSDMAWCLEAVTTNPAKILGLEGYGIAVGNYADMLLLQADDPVEAMRLKPARLQVIRRGEVIASTPRQVSALNLPNRGSALDISKTKPVLRH